MGKPTGNMPALTGLRGVGAIWVMLFHLTYPTALSVIYPTPLPVIRSGYLGVDLFFILSGVVLSHVYANEGLFRLSNYLPFLRNRLARIYPLHIITLCVLGVIVVMIPAFAARNPDHEIRFGISAFIASLLLIQNWGHWIPDSWNVPAWSLSAEWFAYLCFPLILFVASFIDTTAKALIAIAALFFALTISFLWKGIDSLGAIGSPGMVRMFCEFSGGCFLYRIALPGNEKRESLLLLMAAGLLLISLFVTDFAAPFAFATIIWMAMNSETRIARWLSFSPIIFLGEISYSLYLWHWMGIQFLNWYMNTHHLGAYAVFAMQCAFVIVIVAISAASRQLIERPLRIWARKTRKAAPALAETS